ncbi:hypothetical protein ABT282_38430 [Streptomyces sp. NPDC000927]|uniref:hypothetical protein n=1 Tax=Streptomyces sp. NPDC000927 TaxID=3154371 RepID=UPI0033329202
MIPLADVKPPSEGDDADARFWTRERCYELVHELIVLGVRVAQMFADGGGGA